MKTNKINIFNFMKVKQLQFVKLTNWNLETLLIKEK